MSKYLSKRLSGLEPYVPGEQPKDMQYIKLNTNESPFPPSEEVRRAVEGEIDKLQLYSDPESKGVTDKAAEVYGLKPEQCALAGDQIFTDTLGARTAGLQAILVTAIDNHNIWLKLRHVAEMPFIYLANNRRLMK